MSSKIYTKRTSIAGKVPNTSNIDTGELALNLRDGRLYSSNGTNVFEVGANVHSLSVGAGGFSIGNGAVTFPTSDGTNGQVLVTNGTGTLTFQDQSGGGASANSFSVIEVGGTLVKATASTQRLSLDAGSNITLTPTDGNNTIVISSTGGGEVSNAYLTSTFTTNTDFQSALANTNLAISDRLQVANAITTLAGLTDVAQVTPTDGQVIKFSTSNSTFFFAADTGEVSNAYLTSTFTTNTDFQSYVSNTNPRITSLEARPFITTANDETIATASQTVVDSFSATAFRSAKYIVQVTHDDDNNRFQTSEVLLVHNGSAAFLTEYGSVATTGPIASIDADVSGGNVRLLVTPSYNNSTIETVRITVSV